MGPVNILLVDDQPAKLLSYEVILAELGETLVTARSAREALEHLLRTEIAVILVDVCMPEQDGFELVAMIREHPRYEKTAIIFVSAVMMTEPDLLRGYRAGAVDYVPVPVVPALLRAKVKVFAELYRKTRELERLNAELEQRVTERTAEVVASSDQLRRLNEELEDRIEKRTREREEALAQLFEAQKLDTIGQLTGSVAHDFNNLLMASLSSLKVLRKRLPESDSTHRLLDIAIQASERGAALTQRLLAFARRQDLKPQAVDIAGLVGGMEQLLAGAIGPRITLNNQLADTVSAVLVDANQLELAILNLAVNARDAMPDGGVITLSATDETLAQGDSKARLAPGRYVRICISDTGTGMDEATLSKAAEPFFTTKGLGKGTGLGLSMVHGLAAQSGGALVLESRLGHGTAANLWLPAASAAPVPAAEATADPLPTATHPPKPLTVLVVDDDVLVAMGTAAMLEELGHTAIEVNSGAQALEALLTDTNIDVVVTDHAMPGMTGGQLARRIRAMNPRMPIILASGYAELPDQDPVPDLLRLAKPFFQEDLSRILCSALETVAPPAAEQKPQPSSLPAA